MNALVAHPDVLRWFLWAWRADSDFTKTLSSLFDVIINRPIDITITNSTISIFKDVPMRISACPPIVQNIYNDLKCNQNKYFKTNERNHVFRNFKCSDCILNHSLELYTDRIGWLLWTIWWMIKFQPARFFLMKDLISVSLFRFRRKPQTCKNILPLPPWIRKRPKDIKSIYTRLQKPIYYECLS